MEILLLGLVVFVPLFIVGYPLVNPWRYRYAEVTGNGDDQLENLQSARNSVFDALRDLEFDHATGKLSDGDYRALRSRYDAKAAEILQQLDAFSATHARRARATEPARAGERQAGAEPRAVFCRRCGARLEPNDRFCNKCGQRL